jgi:integrase/recombinase XerD
VSKIQLVPNVSNREVIKVFNDYLMSNDLSVHHINNSLKAAISFANYLGTEQSFYDITTKQQVISFLDTKRKSEGSDPEMKWITTWNHYLNRLRSFFRWFHNRYVKKYSESIGEIEWETPDIVKIKTKKSKRISSYAESDIWDLEELKTLIKYEPFKRNKAAIALLWDLNARNHEITMLRIKHIRLKERYGEGEIPHQAKTGSGPILLTFSFPYVRDWLNEHPFRNTPEARLICNLNNGAPVNPEALWTMMNQLKSRITRMIESGEITEQTEKEKLRVLLKTKRFNPYCLRHSSISHDSDFLPDYALKKKVRWSMNSKQASRYIKSRMGNDLKQKILVQNGITPEERGKPIPTIAECPRCNLINSIESKYCSKCSYPLTPSAFDEIKEQEDLKFRSLEKRCDEMQAMVEKLVSTVTKIADQERQTELVKSMYELGWLKGSNSIPATQ